MDEPGGGFNGAGAGPLADGSAQGLDRTLPSAGEILQRNAFIVAGLVLAAFAQMLGLLITGAGHGWAQPFRFSPALFLAYPIVFVRLRAPGTLSWMDVALLGAAGVLDMLLVHQTRIEGTEYFRRVMALPPIPHLWLLLWLLWQALTVKILVSGIFFPRR